MVQIVMEAAAFGTPHGAGHDQLRREGQVAELHQVGGNDEVPIVLLDFLLEEADASASSLESLVGADDAHVVPHHPPDLIPQVMDHHQLVGIDGVAALPGRDLEIDRGQLFFA